MAQQILGPLDAMELGIFERRCTKGPGKQAQ
jgi:hypothetical protein